LTKTYYSLVPVTAVYFSRAAVIISTNSC